MNIAPIFLILLSLASAKDTTDVRLLETQIGDTGKFKGFVEGSRPGTEALVEPPEASSPERRIFLKTAAPHERLERISVPLAPASQAGGDSRGLTSIGQAALATGLGTALLLVVAGNLSDGARKSRPKIKFKPHPAPAKEPREKGFQPDLEPLVSDDGTEV